MIQIDSTIQFQNSQGLNGSGTLMKLSHYHAVFEVYSPNAVLQLSEVLQDIRIRRGENVIYSGKGVVTNLVNTGLMLIASVSLVDQWSEWTALQTGEQLRKEAAAFVQDWGEGLQLISPSFKECVADVRSFLQELSHWLQQAELAAGVNNDSTTDTLSREFASDIEQEVAPQLLDLYQRFETETKHVPKASVSLHVAYSQRELHPLILCAPFFHRTYTKPLGYAGDYEMVNMMLRDPFEGPNTFTKVLNATAMRSDVATAHQHRIDFLLEQLVSESRRVANHSQPFRVLNVGCGPAIEIQRFVEQISSADRAEIDLIDFNQETLDHTQEKVSEQLHKSGRLTKVNYYLISVHELAMNAESDKLSADGYDLIYCAGLFDYLGDSTCAALLERFEEWCRPDGLVVATNVAPDHSRVGIMKYWQEWNLKLRSTQKMLSLVEHGDQARVTTDPTQANVFLEIRKSTKEAGN